MPAARKNLNERIHARTDANARAGMDARKCKALLESGLSEDSKPSIYRLPRIARGAAGRNLWKSAGSDSAATRRYAKRQLTWFRKEQSVRWFSGFGDDAGVQAGLSNGFSRRPETRETLR